MKLIRKHQGFRTSISFIQTNILSVDCVKLTYRSLSEIELSAHNRIFLLSRVTHKYASALREKSSQHQDKLLKI